MNLSVIITTYNRETALLHCLKALSCQSFKEFDVVVVDDGGEDHSAKRTMDAAVDYNMEIRYIWHPHHGFGLSRSRNEGTRVAQGDIYHFLDSDILLCPTALQVVMELMQEKSDRALGGYYKYLPGMLITPPAIEQWTDLWDMKLTPLPIKQANTPIGMDIRDAVRGVPSHEAYGTPDVFEWEHKILWSPFCLLGGNVVIPKEIFDKTGGFDEKINSYGGEDAEMSLNIISHGYGISYSRRIAGAHIAHVKNTGSDFAVEFNKRRYIAAKYPKFLTPDGNPIEGAFGKEVPRDREA